MHNITFDLLGMHRHGAAFEDYLALRKAFFVDTLNWGIPHNARVEMDQYDNPLAFYSLVLDDDGDVIAGARTLPCSANWGSHSYMLRDAALGNLAEIPALIEPDMVTDTVWECTRLVVSDKVKSMRERISVLGLIVDGLVDIARPRGGKILMSLSNLWLHRALNKLGHPTDLWCDPYVNADDGHRYAVMAMPVPALPEYVRIPAAAAVPTHLPQPGMVHAPSFG